MQEISFVYQVQCNYNWQCNVHKECGPNIWNQIFRIPTPGSKEPLFCYCFSPSSQDLSVFATLDVV